MKGSQLIGALGAIVCTLITLPANSALVGVLPTFSGGTDWQAYYDPELDVTWATILNRTGKGTWDVQAALVASLKIGGVGGWRMPNADVNGDGTVVFCDASSTFPVPANCEDNELGFLFLRARLDNILRPGGVSLFSVTPGTVNPIGSWTSTPLPSDPNQMVVFDLNRGLQFSLSKSGPIGVWAVHSGNVVVPLPAAVWLFASGLVGLTGLAGKKQTA